MTYVQKTLVKRTKRPRKSLVQERTELENSCQMMFNHLCWPKLWIEKFLKSHFSDIGELKYLTLLELSRLELALRRVEIRLSFERPPVVASV